MITKKYETIVGLFVVASLVALLVMVLIIAREEGLWQNYVQYHAVFKNISGLKRGSEVRLAGVTVGSVTKTTIRSDGKILVTFEVMEQYRKQIREDTQASIGSIGLLGDRSLDLTPGSPDKPVVPPEGMLAGVEPLDLQELLARAAPSLDSIQMAFNNLAKLTEDMADPKGDFRQAVVNIKETFKKINTGKGTMGLLVSDPKLYEEILVTVASAQNFIDSLNNPQGAVGMLLHDPEFKGELRKVIKEINVLVANLQQGSLPLTEALAKLPAIVKKVEGFLDNLDKAGVALPDLVITGQSALSDVNTVAEAAQKMWLLRRFVPKAQERTIRVEREIK
ncbi:MAG: MlaD family protein [Syntrophobacterales bacterium]|jgi:phospholipid/cholesterol/gamma-HCH transport system substrate-binding protein